LQALSDETLLPRRWFPRQRDVQLGAVGRDSTPAPSPVNSIEEVPVADPGCLGLSRYFGAHKRSLIAAWVFGLLSFLSFGTGSYDVFN
jgi:hypothetical protein